MTKVKKVGDEKFEVDKKREGTELKRGRLRSNRQKREGTVQTLATKFIGEDRLGNRVPKATDTLLYAYLTYNSRMKLAMLMREWRNTTLPSNGGVEKNCLNTGWVTAY